MDQAQITEQVARSWYNYTEGNNAALHPYKGETNPNYTGPAPPYQCLDTDRKYSWLKAPRYDGQVMEVGPLARMLVAYAAGVPAVKQAVDATLKKLGAGPRRCIRRSGASQPARWMPRSSSSQLAGVAQRARAQHELWRPADRRHGEVGPFELAAQRARVRSARGAARLTRPLGGDLERHDLPLSGGRADDVERLAARRAGPARARTSRRWSGRPSPIRRGRSSCCAPCTRSTRAWRARCTCSTPSARASGRP